MLDILYLIVLVINLYVKAFHVKAHSSCGAQGACSLPKTFDLVFKNAHVQHRRYLQMLGWTAEKSVRIYKPDLRDS